MPGTWLSDTEEEDDDDDALLLALAVATMKFKKRKERMVVGPFHLEEVKALLCISSPCTRTSVQLDGEWFHQWATRNPHFPFTLCMAAPSMQSSRPTTYNGKWPERAIIGHRYNALYSGGLHQWCCRPLFMSRPFLDHKSMWNKLGGNLGVWAINFCTWLVSVLCMHL